jgi:probable rRNA maturation factor
MLRSAFPVDGSAGPAALRIELRGGSRAGVERSLLRRVAQRVVAAEGLSGSLLLSIALVDDAAIRTVNREQRGIDAATDVLSFPLLEELQASSEVFALPPDTPRHLGDVLISYQRAADQAAEYGHSFGREVCYLLAHGVLHLLGYDHLEEAERLAMRAREEAALAPLGLTR